MKKNKVTGALLTCLAALSSASTAAAAGYVGIPAGFDFPACETELLAALSSGNEQRLREHAWKVFGGLTQPARPGDPNSEAIWETWYSGSEVFGAAGGPEGIRQLQRRLVRPRQFAPQPGVVIPEAVGDSQLSFTLFNQELKDHTRRNKLQLAATLQSINNGWTPQTPVKDRKIADYPIAAMSLKLVWDLVKSQGFTPIPIWDEQPRVNQAPSQPPQTWNRVVVVDPVRASVPANETRNATFRGRAFPNSHVVSVNSFYHFKLTAQQAQLARDQGQTTAATGDFMVLTGMHFTTKEIPRWVWGTLWWHDKPDDGPFAAVRPDAKVVSGVWRNYLMDASYDNTLPRESDSTPNAVFNPWLEARFPNGVNSNCMACHERAVWSSTVPPFLPVTRGDASPTDPLYRNGTQVDFLWSVLLEGNQ